MKRVLLFAIPKCDLNYYVLSTCKLLSVIPLLKGNHGIIEKVALAKIKNS